MAGYDNRDELKKMLERYLAGEASPAEIRLLESWDALLDGRLNAFEGLSPLERESVRSEMEAKLRESLAPARRPLFRSGWMSYAGIAAALMMAVMLAAYFRMGKTALPEAGSISETEQLLPGGNKAILTLADGTQINLDSNKAGIRISNEHVSYDDGTAIEAVLPQNALRGGKPSIITYNTLTIPRGGQYQVVLPDGTKVWLNAASTLIYPSHFPVNRREVQLTGEGYFKVNNRPSPIGDPVPFVVKTKGQTLYVLGTELNVNAYEGSQKIVTTLVNGKVRVSADGGFATELKPGEETVLAASGDLKKRQADVIAATAWRNGIFYFNDTPLNEMLPQIARWYNIDFSYESDIPHELFTGKMSRKVQLSVLLNFLKNSGIDYQLQGRKLIIK